MPFLLQTPIEFLGHMQRTYDRALAMYGREAGCYVPPRMLEEDLKEDLRFDLRYYDKFQIDEFQMSGLRVSRTGRMIWGSSTGPSG